MAGHGGHCHGPLREARSAARGGGSEISLSGGPEREICDQGPWPKDLAQGLGRPEQTFAAERERERYKIQRNKIQRERERERKIFLARESLGRRRGLSWRGGGGGGEGVLPEVTMARARAVTALAAAAALAAVFGVGASGPWWPDEELCSGFAPFKRECKQDSECAWLPGYGCMTAPDACAAVPEGKGRRKRCEAVPSTTCACSRSRGKCGLCRPAAAPSPAPTPGPLPDPPACRWFPGPLVPETALNPLPLPRPAMLISGRS